MSINHCDCDSITLQYEGGCVCGYRASRIVIVMATNNQEHVELVATRHNHPFTTGERHDTTEQLRAIAEKLADRATENVSEH